MLGPGIILAGTPLVLGYAIWSVLGARDRIFAGVAVAVASIESLACVWLLLMWVVGVALQLAG